MADQNKPASTAAKAAAPGTTAKVQTETGESRGQVAIFKPARLPWHPAIGQRFNIDQSGWRTLCEAIFPAAKTVDAVCLALSYCKARGLDPFKRTIHIVPVYDSEKKKYVETIWPGIAEHRTTATRTGTYAGNDPVVFGPDIEKTFEGEVGKEGSKRRLKVTVKFPEWAQMTVYRMVRGQRVAFHGARVYWLETYARRGRGELPNEMWERRAYGQIGKCAEAAGLRAAFPEELGGDLTVDEVGHRGIQPAEEATIEHEADQTPPRPTRADVAQDAAGGPQESDQESGAQATGDTPSPTDDGAGAEGEAEEATAVGFSVIGAGGEVVWAGEEAETFVSKLTHILGIAANLETVTTLVKENQRDIDRLPADLQQRVNDAVNAKLQPKK